MDSRKTTSGPSDKAVAAAMGATRSDSAREYHRETLVRAYPIIRADVIAEVVDLLRTNTEFGSEYANFVEREFGA